MKQYYNYFYKITNKINGKFYFGVHRTSNLNDGYMGSGFALNKAYEKYGKENFEKEILKYFNTLDEAYQYESEIVNDKLVKDHMCYNLQPGGSGWCDGNQLFVYGKNNEIIRVSKDDERIKSGEYIPFTKSKITAKDSNGRIFYVTTNDERYLSGELVPIWEGRHHTEDTKKKISEKNSGLLVGEKNPSFGMSWITNGVDSLKVNKEKIDEYLNNGWKRGRTIKNTQNIQRANQNKAWIHKNSQIKFVQKSELDAYLSDGWKRGKTDSSTKYNPKPKRAHYSPFNGKVLVEINGVRQLIDKNDERLKNGELQAYSKGKIAVKDKNGKKYYVSVNDPKYLSGELTIQNTALKGKVVVKNNEGKFLVVDKNDERYLSGELTFVTTGMKYKINK